LAGYVEEGLTVGFVDFVQLADTNVRGRAVGWFFRQHGFNQVM
jgi:hypothetical protein